VGFAAWTVTEVDSALLAGIDAVKMMQAAATNGFIMD
jgi:hypothetical protein